MERTSKLILRELPDIADLDVAVIEDAVTGEPEALEVTATIPLNAIDQFYNFMRRLRAG